MSPPPTSIDGTDITGATIDGQQVEEITIDGQTVFSAVTLIDDFEDGNLNEYTNTSGYTVSSSNPISGSFSLETTTNETFGTASLSGLDNYPQRGDSFEFTIDFFEGTTKFNAFAGMAFGVQNTINNNYAVIMTPNSFFVGKNEEFNGRGGTREFAGAGYENQTLPIIVQVDWTSAGFTADFLDGNRNLIDTLSFSDTEYDTGGVGFLEQVFSFGGGTTLCRWDDAIITSR